MRCPGRVLGEGRIPAGSVAPEDWTHGARRVHPALPSRARAVAAFRLVFVQVRLLVFQRSCWCDAFVLCISQGSWVEYRTHPGYMGAAQDRLLPLPLRPQGLTAGHVARRLCPGPGSQLSTAGRWTGLCRGHRATVQSLQRQKSAFPTPDPVPGPCPRCPGPAASGLCPGCGLTPGSPPPRSSEAQLLRMPARPGHRGRPSSLPSAPSAWAPSPVTLSLSLHSACPPGGHRVCAGRRLPAAACAAASLGGAVLCPPPACSPPSVLGWGPGAHCCLRPSGPHEPGELAGPAAPESSSEQPWLPWGVFRCVPTDAALLGQVDLQPFGHGMWRVLSLTFSAGYTCQVKDDV